MARDHAEIYVEIWDDPDFCELTGNAQRLYFFLLSQRRLEYSGVQPLRVSLWAEKSSDSREDAIYEALDELSDRRYVVMDERTQELLIRSFFRRDVARPGKSGKTNANLIRNALDACHRVDSPAIRAVLVREIYRAAPFTLAKEEMLLRFPDLSDPPSDEPPSASSTEGG